MGVPKVLCCRSTDSGSRPCNQVPYVVNVRKYAIGSLYMVTFHQLASALQHEQYKPEALAPGTDSWTIGPISFGLFCRFCRSLTLPAPIRFERIMRGSLSQPGHPTVDTNSLAGDPA